MNSDLIERLNKLKIYIDGWFDDDATAVVQEAITAIEASKPVGWCSLTHSCAWDVNFSEEVARLHNEAGYKVHPMLAPLPAPPKVEQEE